MFSPSPSQALCTSTVYAHVCVRYFIAFFQAFFFYLPVFGNKVRRDRRLGSEVLPSLV